MTSRRIETLLQGEDLLPVVYNERCEGMGKDESCGRNAGDRGELPLWLVRPLCRRGTLDAARAATPPAYNARVTGMLKAAPRCIDLGSRAHFFETGIALAASKGDAELARLLSNSLLDRLQGVYDKAACMRDVDTSPFTSTLTATERELFQVALDDTIAFENWKNHLPTKLHRSKLLPESKKRPREESGDSKADL